jgi:hypothetical protein
MYSKTINISSSSGCRWLPFHRCANCLRLAVENLAKNFGDKTPMSIGPSELTRNHLIRRRAFRRTPTDQRTTDDVVILILLYHRIMR